MGCECQIKYFSVIIFKSKQDSHSSDEYSVRPDVPWRVSLTRSRELILGATHTTSTSSLQLREDGLRGDPALLHGLEPENRSRHRCPTLVSCTKMPPFQGKALGGSLSSSSTQHTQSAPPPTQTHAQTHTYVHTDPQTDTHLCTHTPIALSLETDIIRLF